MAAGLVKGEGFGVDASVMEANASRYHAKAPDELDWTDAQRQKGAVAEYLAGLEAEAQVQQGPDNRKQSASHHRYRARRQHAPLPCLQIRLRCLRAEDAMLSEYGCPTGTP
ncbi:hypothetical protein QA640_13210 [Bradyrhizobium sp. CB82]|uniref:hypothetical protein n=1 Tax=Bradyrhizobium sp. CB82 TaxID=3039159 RepID=UPI0024B12300|nr:hypothetical protein [Bradyrhizobium sp. CB82]WFU45396.1 hypothetical protein QA640_13210 [Bradyrhizobium sp. CB82]